MTLHAAIQALSGGETVLEAEPHWALKFSETPPASAAPSSSDPLAVPSRASATMPAGRSRGGGDLMGERDRQVLIDILAMLDRALGYPIPDHRSFLDADYLQDALIHCLDVIAEAV